jgi:lipoate-protein ligase A
MSQGNQDTWRLILSPPARGPYNMALDHAIMESSGAGDAPPTLRLYAWHPPCLSLGFSQPLKDVDEGLLLELGWNLVRRPTGGRAILHTDELTYMITGPESHPHLKGGVAAAYQTLSRGLIAGLHLLGVEAQTRSGKTPGEQERSNPVCFEVPGAYEITVEGRKLVGSAQMRKHNAVLQHGSLPLRGDLGRICQGLHFADRLSRLHAAAQVRLRATTLEECLGHHVGWKAAAEALTEGFRLALQWRFVPCDPTAAEEQRAQEMLKKRYASRSWLARI